MICKSIGRKGDKVKIIRQPFLIDQIITHELKDGSGFIVVYLNEFKVASAFFILYTSDSRTWIEHLKKAKESYKEAKVQNALLSAQSFYENLDSNEDDTIFFSSSNLMAQSSLKNSRSCLLYSPSESTDFTDNSSQSGNGNVSLTKTISSNFNLPSKLYLNENVESPQKATSLELGDLCNSSLTINSSDISRNSQSADNRTSVSVTVTSPRPERRAFLLRGSGAVEYSFNQFLNANTLSVNVPTFNMNKPLSQPSSNASIQIPSIQSQHINKNSRASRNLQKFISPSVNKPPLIKMKNINGPKIHSAPTSEGTSPVLSFDSEQGGGELILQFSGSDEQINYGRLSSININEKKQSWGKNKQNQKRNMNNERRYHRADSIENYKKEKNNSIHKRLSWNYGQPGMVKKQNLQSLVCNKHLNKCLSSETVNSSSAFSSSGSVPFSMISCECGHCDTETLDNLKKIDLNNFIFRCFASSSLT